MTFFFTPRWPSGLVFVAGLLAAAAGYEVARRVSVAKTSHHPSPVQQSTATERDQSKPDAKTPTQAEPWEKRWGNLANQENSPARTRSLETMLEELGRTEPKRALALALAEGNWLVRDQLRNAALRGWGAAAPDAAADWAMGQTLLGERMQCVSAVLAGAAENPEEAMRVGLRLCTADPGPSGDYGHNLINALVDKKGDFETATRFAVAASMVDRQSYLLDSAFYQWAQHEPDRALEELDKITDPKIRSAALKGVIEGWADADAEKLADFAQTLPPGEERSRALSVALPQWVAKDPEAALEWINRSDPNPDFDKGIAALALLPSLLQNRPVTAMEMTDNITDSAQRSLAKSNVFYQWAMRDPGAARTYASGLQNAEYREMLLGDLETLAASQAKRK